MKDFQSTIEELDKIEDEFFATYNLYSKNDSSLKMNLEAMKLDIIYYKYIITCFELLRESYSEIAIKFIKKAMTITSYFLTGVALFKAREIVIPSLLGSFLLHVKNQQDPKYPVLSFDQANYILDKADEFENKTLELIDNIYNQVDIYEDSEIINKLSEPEKSKREFYKKIMQFIRNETDTLEIDNSLLETNLKQSLEESIDFQSNDFYELLQRALVIYSNLDSELTRLEKKEHKLTRLI